MLDEKKIAESKRRAEKLIKDGIIFKDKPKSVDFFLINSRNSLDSASLLFNVSIDENTKKSLGFPNFDGYLWVVNASYYSMFYLARALLDSQGINVKTELSIHSAVFDALVYYFYLTGRIERKIIEELNESGLEASEILGKELAKGLIESYSREKEKRARFTYEMEEIAMKNKAQTSLERAKKFREEIRKMIVIYLFATLLASPFVNTTWLGSRTCSAHTCAY